MHCINNLLEKNILFIPVCCIKCFGPVKQKSKTIYKCTTKKCRKPNRVFSFTVFEKMHIKVDEAMELFYLFNNEATTKFIIETKGYTRFTVMRWYKIYNILVNDFSYFQTKIGGKDVIVECDESKFGKRKFNRGHKVDGVWVFGMVERTDERKLVLKIVEKRDAATLLPIIKSSVIEGSIVLTDCWRAYNRIQEELGLIHGTVNHSLNYVDPVTLNHTNTIEGTWNGIKMKVPPRKRTKKLITDELIKFQWNRVYESNKWEAFIEALRRYQIE